MAQAETVENLEMNLKQFGFYDYVVFAIMLAVCLLIGIYYAFSGGKSKRNVEEYLMGGRKMPTFPVAASLVASFASGITLLTAPKEIYLHGTGYFFIVLPIFLTGLTGSYLFLPVLHKMELSSAYEYLERRFDKNVRLLGSLMFSLTQVFSLPLAIYVPALAFNQVSGVNVHITTPCICLICIVYTCLGGIKGIVWTHVVQTLFTILSVSLVCINGSLDVGGFEEVWQRNYKGDRLIVPTFDPDLTGRQSFWSITFGGLMLWTQRAIFNQNSLQRYFSLQNLSQARRAIWMSVFGFSSLIFLCTYAGLVMYATFHDCDPLTTNLAKSENQIFPLLGMKVLSKFPGLPGLLITGIFSASLSSLSTGLNSMSAVFLEDFVKTFFNKTLSERLMFVVLRGVVLIFGSVCLAVIVLVEKLGTVLQLATSLEYITSGPVLGLFLCGIFLPWVNNKGALFGGLLGYFGSGFLILGAQNMIASRRLKFVPKPLSVGGCEYYYNSTVLYLSSHRDDDNLAVFPLFKLSIFWYTAFGCLLTIVLALLISALTGFTDTRDLDPMCLSPLIRSKIFKTKSQMLRCEEITLMNSLKKRAVSVVGKILNSVLKPTKVYDLHILTWLVSKLRKPQTGKSGLPFF